MISENVVDLTGYAYNIMVKQYNKFTSIFFTLNVPNRYKKDGEYTTDYVVIPCAISSNKDQNGKHSNSFEKLNEELVEGHYLRVQGSLRSWLEGIKDNQLVPVNQDSKEEYERVIPRMIVRIKDYKLLETKEKALTKSKKYQNRKVEEQEEEKLPNEPYEEVQSEQVEMKMTYFPDFEVPQYKNMTI